MIQRWAGLIQEPNRSDMHELTPASRSGIMAPSRSS